MMNYTGKQISRRWRNKGEVDKGKENKARNKTNYQGHMGFCVGLERIRE